VRQAQLESDWAATVGDKGLGHGNARRKLNAAIIEDQESFPKTKAKQTKPSTPTTPQKPARRTAWGESPKSDAATPGSQPATPLKTPTKATPVNSRSPDEAEQRRLKSLKKKSAQKQRKKKAAEAAVEPSLEGVSLVTQG
jgi:hypothetical protein